MKRREFITLLGGALSAFHCVSASAEDKASTRRSKEMTAKARAAT